MALMTCLLFSSYVAGAALDGFSSKAGPFLEHILYRVIPDDQQQIQALLDDDIDLIGDTVDISYIDALRESVDIDVDSTPRNGYGYFALNCAKYPLNITAFRRAFAFALDKERISDEVWDGYSVPQDSCVPQINPLSIEGMLDYSYYDSNMNSAEELLDSAGFLDIDDDSFREAPDGTDFSVLLEVSYSSPIAIQVGEIAEEALTALGIDAESVPTDFYEYILRFPYRGDYDILFLGSSFNNFDVDWLAYEYWSEYADEPYWNFANFCNATYDSWRDQLLHATDYEDVYEAALEMQSVLIYECPIIVCYENLLISAYRTDKLDGFVNDVSAGVDGWWTNYKAHLRYIHSLYSGGSLRISTPLDIDSFNFMAVSSDYALSVTNNLYDSLIRQTPDGKDIPWLAESYVFETHADNPTIPEGHTQIIFNILQNATWSDGIPLTAIDVAYTMNYYRDAPGNPYGADLSEMTAAYNRTRHQVIIEFSTESYWHLHTIGYKPIIPKHIFEEIGPEGWNLWNPSPPDEMMITSGPYNISSYTPGEYIELSRNENYFFTPRNLPSEDIIPTESNPADMLQNLVGSVPLQHLLVTIPSVIVIAVVLIKWKIDSSASSMYHSSGLSIG